MKLVMYVGLEEIDAVTLDAERIREPGYVGSLKRELLQKHEGQWQQFALEPEFLLVPSAQQTQ